MVFATDVSNHEDGDETRHYELAYSSRTADPETMGRAILASAAVSGLVLPVSIDGVIATDGGWVRNFPLEHASRNPDVAAIAAFRYVAGYRPLDIAFLERMRERLERFRAVPPVRALLAEIRLAEERVERGEPAHYGEMIARLMRVAVDRNTVLEERLADERETSVAELHRLREDVVTAAVSAAPRRQRERLRAELDGIFASARFPFRHDRHVPTLVVRANPGDEALDPTFRGDEPWPEDRKRALIERGYRLTDAALATTPELLNARTPPRRGAKRRLQGFRAAGICASGSRIPVRRGRKAAAFRDFARPGSALADPGPAQKEVGRGPGRRSGPMPKWEAAGTPGPPDGDVP